MASQSVRVFTGFFLLILTARMIGQEYQLGTIRVLLARGVGRLQLLFAKLLTMAIIALILLIVGLALNYLLTLILVAGVTGNLHAFSAIDPTILVRCRNICALRLDEHGREHPAGNGGGGHWVVLGLRVSRVAGVLPDRQLWHRHYDARLSA